MSKRPRLWTMMAATPGGSCDSTRSSPPSRLAAQARQVTCHCGQQPAAGDTPGPAQLRQLGNNCWGSAGDPGEGDPEIPRRAKPERNQALRWTQPSEQLLV